jgi:hypothetical protein
MAIELTMAMPVEAAVRYQDFNFRGVDPGSDCKPLTREWVVETDEHGRRRLRMHWTVVPSSPPNKVCVVKRQ